MVASKSKPRVLALYIGVGQGFRSPAEAISGELQRKGVQVTLSDALHDLGAPFNDWLMKSGWRLCLRNPVIFEAIYFISNYGIRMDYYLLWLLEGKILAQLQSIKPDFIVSTHFTTTFLYARVVRRNNLKIPVYGYDSDVLTAHHSWVSNDVSRYLVPTQEGASKLRECGQDGSLIELTSFPIDRKFKLKFRSVREERKALGIKDMFTVLVMYGGEGIGKSIDLVGELEELKVPAQLLVLCGRNEALKQKLEELRPGLKYVTLVVIGFTDKMPVFMHVSDLLVGKSGLNTVFEAIYMRKPFIANSFMANEKDAALYLVKHNIGYMAEDVDAAAGLIGKFTDPVFRRKESGRIRARMDGLKVHFDTASIASFLIRDAGK